MRLSGMILGLLALLAGISPALASPGFDFVCFNRTLSAKIGFDLEWSAAYLKIDGVETKLDAQSTDPQSGEFSFSNGSYAFRGFAPTGRLEYQGGYADCHQTSESLTALALYGADNGYQWPKFNAPGEGFQTVRAAPSPQAERLVSLEAGTPVTIIENTGEFLDGYFWFRIDYGQGNQGYIWGALLCSNAEDPVLNTVVRRCS